MFEMIEWYLSESGGSVVAFRAYRSSDARLGQAFFNALSETDKRRISLTLFDPFYKDSVSDVERSVTFLIDNN